MSENLKLVLLENTSARLLWVLHMHRTDMGSAALMKSSQPSSLFLLGWGDGKRGIVYPTALKGLNQAGLSSGTRPRPFPNTGFTH